jgi:O-acetylhomoserine/O-acetylserine sulfhydrylase-like pyridoxal-dependent enzyme
VARQHGRNSREEAGITDNLVGLSVRIKDIDEIVDDLKQALAKT